MVPIYHVGPTLAQRDTCVGPIEREWPIENGQWPRELKDHWKRMVGITLA